MQLLDDQTLRGLRSQDPADIRRWLRLNQPASGDGRGFWWENVAARCLQYVYHSQDEFDRRGWALLVAAATDEAIDQTVLKPSDGAIRIANLAAFLSEHGSDVFDPNQVIARCLALIEIPFDQAAREAGMWRSLSRDEMAALRNAKNLISAGALLMSRATDAATLGELGRWNDLRDR